MREKTYLRWYNKVGYGSGDVAGNVVYALLSAFAMIYLTDTVGLNAGVVGTLMMLSKLFDGVSDITFGTLLDRTRTRLGKARPWMLWAFVGCAVTLVAVFTIPPTLGEWTKYAWFFIAYTLLNAVFFTANNISYSALTALITKNPSERVQMGSIRFMFAFGTNLVVQTITVEGVRLLGGGAQGWRAIAIIYALVGLAVNTLSVMSVRELSDEELAEDLQDDPGQAEKVPLSESIRLLGRNKYYLIILVVFIMTQMFTATLNMGIYFMTYILGDPGLLGSFAWAINVPLILGLLFAPVLVSRLGGMYKVNLVGYAVAVLGRVGVIAGGYLESVPVMLICSGVASLGMAPLQGTLNALIAEASENTFLRFGKRVDGLMFSCTSLGVKVGSGLGTALAGWLLAASGYAANAAEQDSSVISMLYFMYLWVPAIANAIILLLLWRLDVGRANDELRAQRARG